MMNTKTGSHIIFSGLMFLALTVSAFPERAEIHAESEPEASILEGGYSALTLNKVIRYHDRNGAKQAYDLVTTAFRGDGSFARLVKKFLGDGELSREYADIFDLSVGRRTAVDYLTKSTGTRAIVEGPGGHPPSGIPCSGLLSLPEAIVESNPVRETMLDYRVIKVTTTAPLPDGKTAWKTERWVAPDLDCLSLRRVDSRVPNVGGDGPFNVQEVVGIVLGEPNQQFFVVPSGYTERSPSEMVAEFERLKGRDSCSICHTASIRVADERYHALHELLDDD